MDGYDLGPAPLESAAGEMSLPLHYWGSNWDHGSPSLHTLLGRATRAVLSYCTDLEWGRTTVLGGAGVVQVEGGDLSKPSHDLPGPR